MRFAWPPLLVLACVLVTEHASAQSVDEARRLYLEADFEAAASAFDEVLARPSLDVETGAEAHRYLAVLRALLGDEQAARRHVALAVALDPAVSAPEGAPPWVPEAMEAARAELGGRAARIAIEGAPEGDAYAVTATLSPSPPGLVRELSLRCVSGQAEEHARGEPPQVAISIVPAAESVHCRASGTTPSGAPLFSAREELAVSSAGASAALLATEREEEDEGGAGAWPWLAAGAGVAVAAVVVAVLLVGSSGGDTATVNAPRAEW